LPESSKPIGDRLREHHSDILSRWVTAIRQTTLPEGPTESPFTSYLAAVLDQIADLADHRTSLRADERSDSGIAEARRRLTDGNHLDEAATELFLLREVLVDFVLEEPPSPNQAADVRFVCWAVDALVRDYLTSVELFSSEDRALPRAVGERLSWTIRQRQLRAESERLAKERDRLTHQLQIALDAAEMGWWNFDPIDKTFALDARASAILGIEVGPRCSEEAVMGVFHAEDRRRAQACLAGAMNPNGAGSFAGEYRLLRPDGEIRWMADYGMAEFQGEGEARHAVSVLGAAADVTDRKRREAALQRSESELRRFYESGMIGIIHFEVGGSITDANERFLEMMGFTREELQAGQVRWFEATPPEYGERDQRAVAEVRATGVALVYEKELIRKDGSRIPIVSGGAAIDDTRQNGVAFVLDLTARKRFENQIRQANEKLQEADRNKNEFLGVLSHELRNPLSPIRNSLYILERVPPGSEQAHRAEAIIDRQVRQLERLVDDLLDITRINRGKIRLQRSRIDLAEVVRRTLEDQGGLLANHRVDTTSPEERLWVDGDAARLSQVLGNLLVNAAKFTPRDGRILVELGRDDGHAVLTVADTGLGMDQGTLDRLFEPFSQAERSLSKSKGGLGLGLALVKGIVELHGGEVAARSEGVGKGARFTVRIPLAQSVAATLGANQAPASRRGGRRVLIVEDNLDSAESLAEALRMAGHQVEVAYDGRAALAKAPTFRPEFVICDIGLPDVDGYSVATSLRSHLETASARLIALTGYAQPEDRRRAFEAGFEAHLRKPPDMEVIADLLAQSPRQPSAQGA
jgi:PAS domain S-box-containing protein